MPNAYLEMAQQYPGLLANVGQQFQQAYFQGQQAKMTEEQHKFEMARQQKADERQNNLMVAQREMAAGRPDIMRNAFPAEYAALQKQQMETQKVAAEYDHNQKMWPGQEAEAQTKTAESNDAWQTKQLQQNSSRALTLLAQAQQHPEALGSINSVLKGMSIDPAMLPQTPEQIPQAMEMHRMVMGATSKNELEKDMQTSAVVHFGADRVPEMMATPEGREKIHSAWMDDQMKLRKAGASQVIVGGNEAIEKGTKGDLEKSNIEAQGNLADTAAIRETMKTVDLGELNSLIGGLGVQWNKGIEKLNPKLLNDGARASLEKALKVKIAIKTLGAKRAARAKQLRALGGSENSKAADLIDGTVMTGDEQPSELNAILDAADEADKRVIELTAKTLRPVTKGGGVSVEPTKTTEPPKQALPQIPPEQLAKYKQARESGASVDQAKAAAGIR